MSVLRQAAGKPSPGLEETEVFPNFFFLQNLKQKCGFCPSLGYLEFKLAILPHSNERSFHSEHKTQCKGIAVAL